ncbi:MAG: superoxide dismutase [Oscillospiraceae bacterium]|nr:superoxide dismutase [Oscillospiraceae bacterium]
MEKKQPIPIGGHTLPPLPYPPDALAPVIDAKTVILHHDKHHKKYVDDLNAAELALQKAREEENFQLIQYWSDQVAFNGSGHILHSVYWTNMTCPGQGGELGKYTQSYIDWQFGGIKTFLAQFTAAATKVAGSGWAILGYNTAFRRLEILQCEKHENLTQWGIVPILVCDVWEHAYYLHYQNDRAGYAAAWWKLVNWMDVENRFIQATRGKLPLELDSPVVLEKREEN